MLGEHFLSLGTMPSLHPPDSSEQGIRWGRVSEAHPGPLVRGEGVGLEPGPRESKSPGSR